MARRWIGQEQMRLGDGEARGSGSLGELDALIDWAEVDQHLASIYAAAKGERAWPPLPLFKALLLSVWYDLSDVKLAEALDNRASFRRFCGFAAHEPTPERTAFVRFRRELVARSLDRTLFEAVTRQLEAKGVMVRTGTLVDAPVIASASIPCDREARWVGHRRRSPVHGDTAHMAADQGAGLVRPVEVTTANVHDGTLLEAVLPQDPGEVTPTALTRRAASRRRSWRGAGCPGWSRPTHGADPRRSPGWRPGTRVCVPCAAGSRRCSGRASAATACAGCAGLVWPRLGCRCG